MNSTPTQIQVPKDNPRLINSWAMYDWANSAYALVVASAIFPAYYNGITRVNGDSRIDILGIKVENTAAYSITLGLAFGFIALISPLISSISDYKGNHKSFMRLFCYMGAMGCMVLFFFDQAEGAIWALTGLFFATVGYSGSIVFYNSYLPAISSAERQDQVSAKGYAFGYIGATMLLIFNFFLILNQEKLGVEDDTFFPRLSFLMTGIWWLGFAQIPLSRLPKGLNPPKTGGRDFLNGYHELGKVWEILKSTPRLKIFLFSFFFYIMGVQTVMFMASSFGEKEVGLTISSLIITVLSIEYLAIGGAFLFARISKMIGNVKALMILVSIWVLICAGAFFIETPFHFFVAAFFIGLVMGGIQSLSRSTYGKMIPETGNNAGFFSFFDVSEKTAMMCGLVLWGLLDNLTGSMRNSIVALAIWFSIGLILLWRLNRLEKH